MRGRATADELARWALTDALHPFSISMRLQKHRRSRRDAAGEGGSPIILQMKLWVLIVVLVFSLPLTAQTYVAGGLTTGSAEGVTLLDRDCGSTQPPALFGCGIGDDGLPFGARGRLRGGRGAELAAGRAMGRARAEIVLASRRGLELDAEANFSGVTGDQPVTADVRSHAVFFIAAVDLGPDRWIVRPFLAGGAGVARNELGAVTFSFPGISEDAVTVTRGGSTTGLAVTGAMGVTTKLRDRLALDIAIRHVDLGRVRGDRGEATIVRPTRELRLEVEATEMRWRTQEVSAVLRRSF
jgi:opacity protein-like surface antigen